MKIADVVVGERYEMRLTTGRFVTVRVLALGDPPRHRSGIRKFSVKQEDSGRVFTASAAKLRRRICEQPAS